MRILQGKVSTKFVCRSDDPARSLHAWVVGSGQMSTLVDDQGITTTINPLAIDAPNENEGIAFAAKDADTLIRGFKYLAGSGKTKGKRDFYLREGSEQNLAALGITWSEGVSRHTNKASAAILTAGYNVGQFLTRAFVLANMTIAPSTRKYWRNAGVIDGYQSISDNMDKAGRDGAMTFRGAAVYICSGSQMPMNLKWGRTYRQIGDIATLGMLATITTKLLSD